MKQVLIILLFMTGSFFYLHNLQAEGKYILKVGAYNNPPKINVSDNGSVSGYHVELIEALLKDSPYKIEYVTGTWDECLERLKTGRIDIMPDVAWSTERAVIYNFNNDYVLLNWAVIYSSKTAAINIMPDLDGKKIAVMKNSIHTEGKFGIINQVAGYGINCEFIFVESYQEAFKKISSGDADAAVVNRLYGLMNEETYRVKRTSIIFNPSQIRYAFRKNNPVNRNLIVLIDTRIKELKNDRRSVLYSAFAKYLLPEIQKEKILPQWTVNIILLAILLSIVFSIYLLSSRSGKYETILLKKFFIENRSMLSIRTSITDHSLTAFALFSVPLFLSILYHGISFGWDNIIWLYIPATVIPVITALSKKHLEDFLKIMILTVSMFLTGILVLLSWGRIGTGFTFFLTAGIIITLIYGKRSGLAVITTGLLITILFGFLTQYKIVNYNYDMIAYSQSPSSWIFAIMALFIMFFTIISGIERFYENLVSAVDNLEQTVRKRTNDLDSVNKNLYKEIEIRRQAEDELITAKIEAEHANSAKGIFLANMSHEIRTPLNAILGYSQILLREKTLPPESRREIEVINSSGEHLLDLINEILDMSKIEAGKTEIFNETFSLYSVMKQVENLFTAKINRKGAAFQVNISAGTPDFITADKAKMKQIIINLIGNAVKFTDHGSIITSISTSENNPEILTFSVTDTGKGIAAEHLENIFAPFEQTSDGRNRGGTGLGLSISRKYAGLMGGDIAVTSEPGKGSCFIFTMPYIRSDRAIAADSEADKKVTGIKNGIIPSVLVVDDREVNRDILVRMLEPLGFPVKEASGGNEALDMVNRWNPDLILLDLIMPDLDGREVIKSLKADPVRAGLKIIVITASVLDIARDEILGLGADAFIRKPFREKSVLNEIGNTFGLEYIYAPVGQNAESGQSSASIEEMTDMLLQIPLNTRKQLINSLVTGDIEMIRNIVTAISDINAYLAGQIKIMTDSFEFGPMIEILKSIEKP